MDFLRHLHRQTIFAYFLIVTLFLAMLLVLWMIVNRQENMAHIVNITGQQRMLSQRIVLLSEAIYTRKRTDLLPEFHDAIRQMETNSAFIRTLPDPNLRNILFSPNYGYETHLQLYLAKAKRFSQFQDKQSRDYLFYLNDHMLNTANAIVSVFEHDYDRQMQNYKYLLAILSILFSAAVIGVYRKVSYRALKQADEWHNRLKLSESKIRSITDNTRSIIFIKDLQSIYRFANPAFLRHHGLREEQIVGRNDRELFGEDEAKSLRSYDHLVLEKHNPVFYTSKLMRGDETYYFATDKFLLYDLAGEPYAICGVATDITEQIILNEEMGKIQKHLLQAQNAAHMLTWTLNRENREMRFTSPDANMILPIVYEGEYFMVDDLLSQMCEKDTDRMLRLFEDAMEYGIAFSGEFHIYSKERLHTYAIVAETDFANDRVVQLYGTVQDITDYAEYRDQMRTYVELVDNNIITSKTDLEGVITYVSQAFSDISGYSKAELIGKTHRIVHHPDMPSEIFKELWETIRSGGTWKGEIKNRTKNGESYWVNATISPNYDFHGHLAGYTAIRQDITDKKIIEQIAITDGLTGLYNRHYFNQIGQKELNRTLRDGKVFAFAILDVDNFKKYNDTYGHQAGDHVLSNIAAALQKSFQRGDDTVFRLGGEEFGVILSAPDTAHVLQSLERARAAIEELNIEHIQNLPSQKVTASFGVIVIDDPASHVIYNLESLYKQADDELYRAKESGRNRVCFANA